LGPLVPGLIAVLLLGGVLVLGWLRRRDDDPGADE
jgi:hypothetical protein